MNPDDRDPTDKLVIRLADIEARARYALQNELMVSTYWPSVVEISGAELCGVRVRFTSGFNA